MSTLKGFLSKAKALSRSTLSVVLVLCLLMLMIPTVLLVAADDVWNGTTTDPYSGAGTEASPFIIETGAQLAYMAERVNNGQDTYGHFQLAADIDLNDKNWTPIGNTGTTSRFMGTFDGKDHTITGLYISVTEHYQGLFGAAQNATIKNLKIKDADITAYSNVGGIVGATWATVNITNCSFSGAIDATVGAANTADDIATGGLVGGVKGGTTTIDGCTVEAGTTITSHQGATLGWAYSGTGGLVGSASSSSALNVVIRNSSSAANITTLNKTTGAGGNGTGGIMGVVRSTGGTSTVKVTMTNTYSTGAISGGGVRGGLLGFMRTTGATATGKVEAEIKDCYSTVSGLNSGLIGKNYNSSDNLSKVTVSIKNSYFAGQATNPIFITDSNNGTINLTMDRVYYLAGSATAANMFTPEKNGATISISNVSETASLTDGTLVAALNNGRNVWYQGVNGPILPKAPKITNLEVGDGLINFSAEVTEYNVFLDNTVTSLTVKPTVEAGTAVTVAGESVTSGTAKTVDLTANDTTVIEVKISRDGTDKIYTVSVTCAALWDGVSAEPYPNADEEDAGTKENPYQIGLPSHLAYMAQQINLGNDRTAYYELVANIALADKQWTPIGGKIDGTNRTFGGTFNGNGYSITGLNYTYDITTDADNDGVTDAVDTYNAASAPGRSSGGVGLFGLVAGATIKNVTVQGSVVTDQYLAGGLIGGANGSVTLKNCHFNGTVRSGSQSYTSYAGGLIAQAATAGSTITITDCSFNGSVTADQTKWYTYTSASDTTLKLNTQTPEAVGGFIGYLSNGAVAFIADSYVNAVITANGGNGIGGMIGSVQYGSSMTTATIERCYTSGSVTGNSGTGGIVGWVRDNSTTPTAKAQNLS